MSGKTVLGARHCGNAGLARLDPPLMRRAVHEVLAAEFGTQIDKRQHDIDGLSANGFVLRAD
jgi:hypothetical protein